MQWKEKGEQRVLEVFAMDWIIMCLTLISN